MTVCEAWMLMKNEEGISKHFPITHFNAPTIFESKNMMLGSVIKLKGVPYETENSERLNQLKDIWHRSVTALGDEFCLYVTTHRRRERISLEGQFDQDFLQAVDNAYHRRFRERSLYVNDLYITLIYRGLNCGKARKSLHVLDQISSAVIKRSRQLKRKEQMTALQKAARQLLVSLSSYSPHLLGECDADLGYSELLQFLALFVNQGASICYPLPDSMPTLMPLSERDSEKGSFYPLGQLSHYITRQRIFFGDAIQFQGQNESDTHYAAMLSVKRYATQTSSTLCDYLLQLDCEYLATHSFAIESNDIVQKKIHRHRIKMDNVNDPARSQREEMSIAQDLLASDKMRMGYHHNTLMLVADTLEALECCVANAIKCYAESGFVAVRETIGQEAAFWAQIPTNLKMIARSALITSHNFVDFCPLHNYRTGYRDANHLGAAVTLLETPSRTPFFFNFHAKGSKNNPSKGHTSIIGGNGSGKTVTLAFLDAQCSRYGGRTFVFDRDRGLEIYLRACGGYYAILSPDHPNEISMNPFQLEDTPVNRKFCREWMGQLLKDERDMYLDATVLDAVDQCIDYAFSHLDPQHRNLTQITQLLPIHFSKWPQLRRWLRASNSHPAGEYAYLFDNDNDDLSFYRKMGFDMTHFLDQEPSNVLVALMMYLFHRLEQSFDGQLVTVLLDEGWQYLNNSYWVTKLKKWLPTLRKLNCHIVFATQSTSSVIESPLRATILDNCATHLYFANPQAKQEEYIQGFNLTTSEFQIVKEQDVSTHRFLLKQEHESCVCQLNLFDMPELLSVFSANKRSLTLLDQIRNEVGEDPKLWLPLFYERRRDDA